MLYHFLADLVAVIHLFFILFVVLGGFFVYRFHFLIWFHLPSVLWAAFIELSGWICPLTPLENLFRLLGGDSGYSPGFVEHYLLPIIYPSGLTQDIQIVLGIGVILLNLIVYCFIYKKNRKNHSEK